MDFLLLVLSDEASRRDGQSARLRAPRARLDPTMQLEAWDPTARVTFDRALPFLEARAHWGMLLRIRCGKVLRTNNQALSVPLKALRGVDAHDDALVYVSRLVG